VVPDSGAKAFCLFVRLLFTVVKLAADLIFCSYAFVNAAVTQPAIICTQVVKTQLICPKLPKMTKWLVNEVKGKGREFCANKRKHRQYTAV
jgi:hypothetical protein